MEIGIELNMEDVKRALKKRGMRVSAKTPDGINYVYFHKKNNGRFVRLELDLWGVGWNISKKGQEIFRKKYKKYLDLMFESGSRKSAIHYVSVPKILFLITVLKEDCDKWVDFLVNLIRDKSNLEQVRPFNK